MVLTLMASVMLIGAPNADMAQQNNAHGRFQVTHVPSNELPGLSLNKCDYNPGSNCLFLNRDRINDPVALKFRFDPSNVNLANAVPEAEYVAWIQRNNNACHFSENDASVHRLAKAPVAQQNVAAHANPLGVIFEAHRIEMNSAQIMALAGDKPLAFTQWQLCVGVDPEHGATIDPDKHPVGGMPFYIGTQIPAAPTLAGIKSAHEKITATVNVPTSAVNQLAAVGLRAIPTKIATLAPVTDAHSKLDANQMPPAPTYMCPDWSDYDGMAVGTGAKAEFNLRNGAQTPFIDADEGVVHLPIALPTQPDETYVVCAYVRDRVNNVSEMSTSSTGRSYRATDFFAALPHDAQIHMGHNCSDLDMTPLSCAAAACAWASARLRLRRRWRKTRH